MEADHHPGGIGLIQEAQHLFCFRFRPDVKRPFLGFGAHRLVGQQLQDPGQLQGSDGFFK